ncbi:SDR family NAD(P)-dependent oxidoreductase [Verticiella sediminum]|uniref:SDR family NAD(P)-dependent oxidoreductase n=1 Tax=Verticiella sediminum TaxID=1247510 RepID=A0A556AYE2_9BURK|nr:SDR family NAD(P)-dependent oxidoreductase [Verticiella sediminum]TSH97942.1 SDR family NAD(P)-dependent oxidoreductase [Verticiella sediminum]
MKLAGISAVVTGGASGLGLATARELIARGAHVLIVDLPTSAGADVALSLGGNAAFAAADVTSAEQIEAAYDMAETFGPLRALVHCAGGGGPVRFVDKEGNPGSLERYEAIVRLNLIGSFNVVSKAAARMARNEVVDGERGACVMTASVAAYEGQIGQAPYASAKAGIVGMTLVAARDLASKNIRVNTIAPGIFDTPLLARLPEDIRHSLGQSVPNPARLGAPAEFGSLACQMLENGYLNGETIRLDGAIRMQPR